jgi:hypothetical protein
MGHSMSRRQGHATTPPPGSEHLQGASGHAPPGNGPARRASEQGGISIAELLLEGLLPYGCPCNERWAFARTTIKYSVPPTPLVKRVNPLVRERFGVGHPVPVIAFAESLEGAC